MLRSVNSLLAAVVVVIVLYLSRIVLLVLGWDQVWIFVLVGVAVFIMTYWASGRERVRELG